MCSSSASLFWRLRMFFIYLFCQTKCSLRKRKESKELIDINLFFFMSLNFVFFIRHIQQKGLTSIIVSGRPVCLHFRGNTLFCNVLRTDKQNKTLDSKIALPIVLFISADFGQKKKIVIKSVETTSNFASSIFVNHL